MVILLKIFIRLDDRGTKKEAKILKFYITLFVSKIKIVKTS